MCSTKVSCWCQYSECPDLVLIVIGTCPGLYLVVTRLNAMIQIHAEA
jgi:hypothetical protein